MPYIPLYIGDWEQDTNCISIEAEGALLKLTFKLWKSQTKGLLSISFNQLSILLKKSEENALKIIKELQENNVLNIVFLPEDKIKIESRRMIKDAEKSITYSKNGSKGGRGKKSDEKQIKSKLKAKSKLIPEYDNDNEDENDNEVKGGVGESKSELIEIFFNDLPNCSYIETISRNTKLTKDQVLGYIPSFRLKADVTYPSFDRFVNHFKNFINLEKNGKQKFTSDRQERLSSLDNLENLAESLLRGDQSGFGS